MYRNLFNQFYPDEHLVFLDFCSVNLTDFILQRKEGRKQKKEERKEGEKEGRKTARRPNSTLTQESPWHLGYSLKRN